jgi:hypothetical protein
MGPNHVQVTFADARARFVWPFFSSTTLALFTVFQASCFCFAFYRLMRAFLIQRKIEVDSKDAAVLFKGIGWINLGIKIGAIETVVGFVFFGIPIAYIRRVLRMLSRAFLCIGVAKGFVSEYSLNRSSSDSWFYSVDLTEDFKAFQDELESLSSDEPFRRSRLRELISNPQPNTFRQLSPTATAFHAIPRAPALDYSRLQPSGDEKSHPYAASAFLTTGKRRLSHRRSNIYAQSPLSGEKSAFSPIAPISRGLPNLQKPTVTTGLPGMSEFAEIKAKRMSQRPPQRVTVFYHHGTPTLHLRFSRVELPSPAVIADSIKNRPTSDDYLRTPASQFKGHSRFSFTSRESSVDDTTSVYPILTTHGHAGELEAVTRHRSHPYGLFTPSSHDVDGSTFVRNRTPTTPAHDQSRAIQTSLHLDPPLPAYLDPPSRRFSDYSDASGISAVQAEIVDAPHRKLSIPPRSVLARAVLYPVPGTRVVKVLSGESPTSSSTPPPKRLHRPRNAPPNKSSGISYPSLPASQRPTLQSFIPGPEPVPRLTQQQRGSIVRESFYDEDGNVITVTAIAPSLDEELDHDSEKHRSGRALSGYSVGSVPETLQAVRELARKFPGLPPGAVVADIGFRAAAMTPVKERDEVSSVSAQSHSGSGESDMAASIEPWDAQVSVESTDTEEIISNRIPAEMKAKGKMDREPPSVPLPPVPDQQVQRLPPMLPTRNPLRSRPPRSLPTTPQNVPLRHTHAQAPFTEEPLDPFDDDMTSYRDTTVQLSPLSMSVNLQHPPSFISTKYPPTSRNSVMTTGLPSPVTSFSLSSYQNSNPVSPNVGHGQQQPQSRESITSPGVIDFGTALKEWNDNGQKIPGVRPMTDLATIEMIEGYRRNLRAQRRAEFNRQPVSGARRRQPPDSTTSYDLDVSDELPEQLQQHRQQSPSSTTTNSNGVPLSRIKSIGKAPRRITPQPTRGHAVRGSMYLQPLVIPVSSSSKDVPISAVGAGGARTILGVNKAGKNIDVAKQEQDDVEPVSATTEATSSNGLGVVRYSEVLSVEDGGYVPIRLQKGIKGSF